MALQTEVWVSDVIETLEKDAAFTSRMKNLDGYVANNILHFTNEGAAPQILKNPTVFPLTPTQRIDNDIITKLDQYVSEPTLVTDLESAQLNYDKRQSVMGQHNRRMIEFLGDSVLGALLPTASGQTVTVAPGKLFGYADILKVANIFNKANISAQDRHLEIPADMFTELLQDEAIYKQYISGLGAVTNGQEAVLRVAGIALHQRATVAQTAGGKMASLAYQKDAVGVCKGTVDVMVESGDNGKGNPLYVGALMNTRLWFTQVTLRPEAVVAVVRG